MALFERVRELVGYDPDTGDFWWKVAHGSAHAGREAGTVSKVHGYRYIGIDNRDWRAHRIAWLLSTGALPPGRLDHINGERADNRISNLRLASHSQNLSNRGRQKNNKSGFKGVSYIKADNLWDARISFGRKQYCLGHYRTPEEAHAAYVAAAVRLHGEFARTE